MGERVAILNTTSTQEQVVEGIAQIEEVLQLETQYISPAAAEPEPSEDWMSEEKYASSLHLAQRVGAVAARSCLDTEEGLRLKEAFKADWQATLTEMLNSDKELRRFLEINREHTHTVRDSKVMALDAEGNLVPVVDIVERGARASAKAVLEDPRMQFQATRDQGDIPVSRSADQLSPGEVLIVASLAPKKAFQQYGSKFVEGFGYREGWGSMQWYFRHLESDNLTMGAYTFNDSDLKIMSQVFSEHRVAIPADVTEDTFILHGITANCETIEQVRELVNRLRDASYTKQGVTTKRYSVDDFVAANQQIIDQVFETQYLPMAESYATGCKNDVIHSFVKEMLDNPYGLKSGTLARLANIYHKETFDAADARLMGSLIRYGLVEQLRPMLERLGSEIQPAAQSFGATGEVVSPEQIARKLAGKAMSGIRARRTYGGCVVEEDLFEGGDTEESDTDPLDNFGGKAKGDAETSEACVIDTDGCYCCGLNTDGTSRTVRLTVKAYIDARGTIHCMRGGCGAWLAKGGKDKYVGLIAKRAERLKKQEAKASLKKSA